MTHKKIYVCGNGYDTWTVDYTYGHGNFELVKEFKMTIKSKNDGMDMAINQQRQSNAYDNMRQQAMSYAKTLSEKEGILLVGTKTA